MATGKRKALWISARSEPLDRGAAGIAEPEQASALVERLAGSVVERRAEPLRTTPLAHREQQRVPSAREQAEERRLERIVAEVERGDVPLQMVDRNERQATRPGDRLRSREAHEQGTDQSRPLRDRHLLHVVERCAGLLERRANGWEDELQMIPRRNLRHHAAVPGVKRRLRRDDRGEHDPLLGDQRGRGLVAGRLDPEDHDAFSVGVASRHMISASSRLSV